MQLDYEGGLENLKLLRLTETPLLERNESTTRLHLINRIILEVLGWDLSDCYCEVVQQREYADYILGNPRRLAIWEAKKEGVQFQLPVGLIKPICKISTLCESSESLKRAVDQVLHYCHMHGVGIAVISNGQQVVAFIDSRHDGVAPLEGNALCFMSQQLIEDNFRLFWDNLSKPGVESLAIHKTLRAEGSPLPPEKLSARISRYPGSKNRNEQQANLKSLGDLFLIDLAHLPEDEEEFLKYCYAQTGALSQYSLLSKQILETRYSLMVKDELAVDFIDPAQRKHGLSDTFRDNLVSSPTSAALSSALKRRPVILLGDVGVGKTIFLRNLIRVYAKTEFQRSISLYVDFLREPALSSDLSGFVQRRCESQLRNDYGIDVEHASFVRDVYRGDLLRFAKGIHGEYKESKPDLYAEKERALLESKIEDRAAHLRASLEQIFKAHHRQIVLFLDNIDQRSPEFQEQVFMIGHAMAESWPIVAFICLRPDTFYHSMSHGSLTAYQPRAFSITPPRIDLVITKRLEYALGKLQTEGRMGHFPSHIALYSDSLKSYLLSLIRSIRQNEGLIELIDNFSGRNVRVALGFVNTFIGSGHVNTRKIIDAQQDTGYIIPVHEFLRALIFGDHEHYDPTTSQVCNVFDLSVPDGREHFLLLILLSFIERKSDAGEGYASTKSLFEFGQGLDFQAAQIHSALDRAVGKGLIETSPQFATPDRWLSFRISSIGAYTIHRLVVDFSYIDAMIVDTPILSKETRAKIIAVHELLDRVVQGELFLAYLDEPAGKLDCDNAVYDWPSKRHAIADATAKIRKKAIQIAESNVKPIRRV